MRLFVAIELSKNMKNEISRLSGELSRLSGKGRFTPPENLHLTLKFLGETNNLAGAANAMKRAVMGIRAFELGLGGLGAFERGETKTVYLKVNGNLRELCTLQESLSSIMCDEGFGAEYRKYTPHITLGRNVEYGVEAERELSRIKPAENIKMTVNKIVLFESIRKPWGMVYMPLHIEDF